MTRIIKFICSFCNVEISNILGDGEEYPKPMSSIGTREACFYCCEKAANLLKEAYLPPSKEE